jgi:hypothetical protein
MKVVVSLVPSFETPMIRKVAEGGKVRHADGVVINPRSIDQYPAGVIGWLLGNPRTWSGAQESA